MSRREACGTSTKRIPVRPLASCQATSPDKRTACSWPGRANWKYTLHAGGSVFPLRTEVPPSLRSTIVARRSSVPG